MSPATGKGAWTNSRNINGTISVLCSVALLCSFLCLCFSLFDIKRMDLKEKDLFSWCRRPHGAARLPDVTDNSSPLKQNVGHAHTHKDRFHVLQGHLAITRALQMCTQFNFSGIHFVVIASSLSEKKKRDNRTTTDRRWEYASTNIYICFGFFFFLLWYRSGGQTEGAKEWEWCYLSYGEQTRGICLAARSLAFGESKKPPEATLPPNE